MKTVCLDKNYSTTRLVTKNKPDEKSGTTLFLSKNEERKGEGGLRTKGYFKKSYPDKPLVTVITVVFNGEKYLEETIKSVIEQTYDNVEYLIIDGGSTDNTLNIIKKYEDYIDYWVSEKDKGIYDAMNKGIDLATGEWLNFMNAGDRFYNNTILNDIFSKPIDIKINILYGNWATLDFLTSKEKIKKAGSLKNLYKGSQFCHQSSFIDSKLHKATKYNLCYKIAADFDFFYKTYKKAPGSFKYFNRTISFIAPKGLSDTNRINTILNFWLIVEKNNKINFYYLKRVITEILKNYIKKVFFNDKKNY